MNTKNKYQSLRPNHFDNLLEGIQIIDREWRYVYLNNIMLEQSRITKEDLIGFTMMEKYPGIENTVLFEILKMCMEDRQVRRFENQFVFPDHSVRWFDLSIQPAKEGICILSLDITEYKIANEKIEKGKSLYSFLSQINQAIVHLSDEDQLFSKACSTAYEIGKFSMAWIGLFDENYQYITMSAHAGLPPSDLHMFEKAEFGPQSPQSYVLNTSSYYVNGDIPSDLEMLTFKNFAIKHGIKSGIVLPLWKSEKIIGTFNLYSDQRNFIGEEEIELLNEVTTDISFALDIIERAKNHRETQALIVKNEMRFRALLEKSEDMKTLADREGNIIYGSPSISKILGYDPKQMRNARLFDIIHPDDLDEFKRKRETIIDAPGKSFMFQIRVIKKNGEYIWCEGIGTNLLEDPAVEAVVSNFRDISDKKHAEQQIAFDRNNLNALINNTDDLMWSLDTNMSLITANTAFQDLISATYGKPLKQGDALLTNQLSEQDYTRYKKFYDRAMHGESFKELIQFSNTPDHWFEVSMQPIRRNNEVVGVACYAHDITERISSQRSLEEQNKKLIKANFELDRFVYSVSHDLRSPLTSILGLLTFIEEETIEPDTLEHTKMVRSRIERLDEFIKNILNYSRNSRIQLEFQQISLHEIVVETVNSLYNIKEAQEIDFQISISEEKPFYSDVVSLRTILENTISNAIKFHASDNRQKYIRIHGEVTETNASLSIEDNGIGIAPEFLGKIFQMFFRTSAAVEGSGIGLYIVKEVVEKMHGEIGVTSEPGRGTSININLPNIRK